MAYESVEELVDEDAVEELEALALKHPEVREHVYNRLIQKATNDGDFEKARKYVNRFVPDPERQQQMIGEIDNEKKEIAISKDRMAQIETRLAEIPEPRQRAWVLYMNAHAFGATDRNAALKLLNQANDIVDGMKPGETQTETRLIIAMLFCFEKSDRGFSIMESLVPKFNELVEIAVKLDGYDTSYLRDGEWNMSSNGSVGRLLTHLSRAAGYFAWADFDRAVSLTSQFERPEIRMMGHLKLAQGILEGPPKRMIQR